jgi:hypothetical protein
MYIYSISALTKTFSDVQLDYNILNTESRWPILLVFGKSRVIETLPLLNLILF